MRADGARREEEPVTDFAVGQAFTGQADDLALLGGQLREAVRFAGRVGDGHSARSELGLGPLRPGPGLQPPEGSQGLGQDGLSVVDPAAAPQPFGVAEAKLGALEWPLVSSGIRERLVEMGFGPVRVGENTARLGDELVQPGRSRSAAAARSATPR